MLAAVYRSIGSLVLEDIAIPVIGPGELLVRIHVCGVCGTDLKKIQYGLQPGPRVFGHEMAGVIDQIGAGVSDWNVGDRVAVLHHVSCGKCYYCHSGLDSQCMTYRETSTTAGFEPAGGGFAEYIRVMPRSVNGGVIRIPDSGALEQAAFIEPLNTCLKGVRRLSGRSGDTVLVFGLGPIGLMISMLARRDGYQVVGMDPVDGRRKIAEQIAGIRTLDPTQKACLDTIRDFTAGQGVDGAIVATPAIAALNLSLQLLRPGGRAVLFANTRVGETANLDVGDLCVHDKQIMGSYSSSMELVEEVSQLVFNGEIDVDSLMTHRFSLRQINKALETALNPAPTTLKVMVQCA